MLANTSSGTGSAESSYSWIIAETAFIYGRGIGGQGRRNTGSVGFIEDAARNGALRQFIPITKRRNCGSGRRRVVLSCRFIY